MTSHVRTIERATALRVVQVTPRFFPSTGGVETHVKEVADRLRRRGVEVEAIAADPSHELPPHVEVGGLRLSRHRAWPRGRDWCLSPGLLAHVVRGQWDLVHCQGVHTFVAPFAMLGAWLRRTPYVVTFHTGGHSSPWRTKLRRWQWRTLRPMLRRAAALVAVCEWEIDLFSEILKLPRSRFHLIRNGADLPPLPADPAGQEVTGHVGDDELLVVTVGRLERYKGQSRVLHAFIELTARRPARLSIVGTGPDEICLRAEVERLGVDENVTFVSFSRDERDELARLLRDADVMVLLSEYEAHPVAVMEALSMGCPVLVAATSGLTELAELGWVEAVASDASPTAVADAIERTAAAGAPAVDLPSWDACSEQLLGLYQATLGRSCAS